MKFRPCIDIHAGVVKQIVGSTLSASDDVAPVENFATSRSAADYAKWGQTFTKPIISCLTLMFCRQYRDDSLYGGHVIMLGPNCEESALGALTEFPQGLQIGGNNYHFKHILQARNLVPACRRNHFSKRSKVYCCWCESHNSDVICLPRWSY